MPRPSAALAFLYSGGPSNEDPLLSLGGQVSTAAGRRVPSQTLSGGSMSGVTILYATRNPLGAGTLSYNQPTMELSWTPFGGATATLSVATGGIFAIGPSTLDGYIVVEVDTGLLPVSNESVALTAADVVGSVFDTPTSSDLSAGAEEFRCIYLANMTEGAISGVTVSLVADTTDSVVEIGTEYVSLSQFSVSAAPYFELGASCFATNTPSLPLMATSNRSEYLSMLAPNGFPVFMFADGAPPQNSDGVIADLPFTLADRYDSGGLMGNIAWTDSLTWDSIPAGRMVSFFVKRTVPIGATFAGIEKIHLDIALTVG